MDWHLVIIVINLVWNSELEIKYSVLSIYSYKKKIV